jgi:Domain of unknown function (DUF1992)
MGLQHVDLGSVLRRLAEKRIEDAMKQGKFDNLPGAGKPLELEPMPADENARLTWWALRILRKNDFMPEEVTWRKGIDYLKERLERVRDEAEVEGIVARVNELVRKVNTLGTNALKAAVVCLDVEEEKGRVRVKLQAPSSKSQTNSE